MLKPQCWKYYQCLHWQPHLFRTPLSYITSNHNLHHLLLHRMYFYIFPRQASGNKCSIALSAVSYGNSPKRVIIIVIVVININFITIVSIIIAWIDSPHFSKVLQRFVKWLRAKDCSLIWLCRPRFKPIVCPIFALCWLSFLTGQWSFRKC